MLQKMAEQIMAI